MKIPVVMEVSTKSMLIFCDFDHIQQNEYSISNKQGLIDWLVVISIMCLSVIHFLECMKESNLVQFGVVDY